MIAAAVLAFLVATSLQPAAAARSGPVNVVRSVVRVRAEPVAHDELRPGTSYIGTVTTLPNFSGQSLNAIAYDPDDAHYYVDLGWSFYRIESTGQTTLIANLQSANCYGSALVWDENTHLFYLSCPSGYSITSVSTAGTIALIAGGTHGTSDGTGNKAQFQYPSGMALDPSSNMFYVVDNDRMRTVTETGKVTTVGPTGQLTPNGFGQAYSMALDTASSVIAIADGPANLIVGFNTAAKTYQPIAGLCIPGGYQVPCAPLYVDGPASSAMFANPQGVAYDPVSDAFYVVDQSNYMIRRIASGGTVVRRIAGSGNPGLVDGTYVSASFSSPACAQYDPSTGGVMVCDNGSVRFVTTIGQTPPPPRHSFDMRALSNPLSGPSGIATTADGSVWFTEQTSGLIGRIAMPGRRLHEYGLPAGHGRPYHATIAPDGAVAFGDYSGFGQYGNPTQTNIGEIASNGKVTEVAFPAQCGGNNPSIPWLFAPDISTGDLWFTDNCPSAIGYLTPQHSITQYVTPTAGGFAVGLGAVWLGESFFYVQRYSMSGALLQTYPVAGDQGIVIGSDGKVWALSSQQQTISSLDLTTGKVVEYQLSCGCQLGNLVWGPDNALWFTESGSQFSAYPGSLARMNVRGTLKVYPLYEPRSQPQGITFDAGGKPWVADFGANKIGRML